MRIGKIDIAADLSILVWVQDAVDTGLGTMHHIQQILGAIRHMKVDHIALITELTPGTTYYYRIGNIAGSMSDGDPTWRFTTSTHTQEQLSFWVTGDFGAANTSQMEVRDAFIDYVDPDYPDFWLWLGDNAYDDGRDQEYQERVFTAPYGYEMLLTFLPFYPVPGNHDYGSVNSFAPPAAHRGPYYEIVEVPQNGEAGGIPSNTELYYSFDYSLS